MEKVIYLTFDDGPNEPYTSEILKTLSDFNAKATFFVCGQNIEKHTESLKKIADAGHSIGNHSFSHNIRNILRADNVLIQEINKTEQLIKEQTGIQTKLYRSPWGLVMLWLKPWLQEHNYTSFHWNIMAFDWSQPAADYIARHIIDRAYPGAVILLHDGNQTFGGDRSQTVKALPIILQELTKQGYKFEKLTPETKTSNHILGDLAEDSITALTHYI